MSFLTFTLSVIVLFPPVLIVCPALISYTCVLLPYSPVFSLFFCEFVVAAAFVSLCFLDFASFGILPSPIWTCLPFTDCLSAASAPVSLVICVHLQYITIANNSVVRICLWVLPFLHTSMTGSVQSEAV